MVLLLLSWALVIGGSLALGYGVLLAQQVHQAATAPDWLSFSGVAALLGVAIQWGDRRRQLRDVDRELQALRNATGVIVPRAEVEARMNRLEDKIDTRFDRVESQMDALFQQLNVDRRQEPRA